MKINAPNWQAKPPEAAAPAQDADAPDVPEQAEEGDTVGAEEAEDQAADLERVEVVFRYRVAEGAMETFPGHLEQVVRNGGDGGGQGEAGPTAYGPTRVTLWQPVLGSDADLWELRLAFADHASLGRHMDDQPRLLASLNGSTLAGVTPVEVDNPVLRRVGTWSLGESAAPGTTSVAE